MNSCRDEFVILFPDTDPSGQKSAMNKTAGHAKFQDKSCGKNHFLYAGQVDPQCEGEKRIRVRLCPKIDRKC